MAEYNPKRSAAWNYGGRNWKLSRSKIGLYQECPRCFYIDNKLGTKRVPIPTFQLNKAVDNQLKNEFDAYRAKGEQHPIQREYKIDAKPVNHEQLDVWRENFKGVQCHHELTGLTVTGAIDDLWVNGKGEHIVVDYKATAKVEPVKELSGKWHEGYKRQIEIYQWLLRKNNLKVSNTGYILYCTGIYNQPVFDKKLEFDVHLIEHTGDDAWVEPIIVGIKKCLDTNEIPSAGVACEHCAWWNARNEYETELRGHYT